MNMHRLLSFKSVHGYGMACAVLTLLLMCCGGRAGAQAPSVQPNETLARSLFEQGVQAGKRGELREARRLFSESRDAVPAVSTLLNLAIVQGQLQEPLEALASLTMLEQRAIPERDQAIIARARQVRLNIEAELGALELELIPEHAQLTVDGMTPFITAEHRVLTLPGSRLLRAEAAGYLPLELTVDVQAGKMLKQTLRLAELPTKVPDAKSESASSTLRLEAPVPSPHASPNRQPRENDAPTLSKSWRRVLWVGAALAVGAGAALTGVMLLRENDREPPAGDTRF